MNDLVVLSTRERAFAVVAVRALGDRAEAVCGRRSAALKRHAAMLYASPARLGEEAARLDRAVPAGVERVHPSWFTAAPASSRPEAAAWLGRRAYGHLVEMAPVDPPAGGPRTLLALPYAEGRGRGAGSLDRLEREDAHVLGELVVALGRRRVATAFSGAPRAALAQLCARLGEPAATELLHQVRAQAGQVASEEVRAAQRALFHLGVERLSASGAGELARSLFVRAGCGWLGPALQARGGDRLRRVAQRLPRAVGEQLIAGAGEPATDADSAAAVHAAAVVLATPRPGAL